MSDGDQGDSESRRPTIDVSLRALLTLAWPVVLSRAALSVIGLCDALMTAPLGEDALAAATIGAMNTLTVMLLPMGVALIVQSFASQLHGQGDGAGARRYGWYGLILAGLAGLLGWAAIPLVEPVLGLMAYEPSVSALMGEYIELRLIAVATVIGYEAIGAWYGGVGNTRVQMVGSLLMMVVNVALNYLLIEGHLGAPALGVRGAAIASVVATSLGCAVLVGSFLFGLWTPDAATGGRGEPGEGLGGLSWQEFGRMVRFGLPNGINYLLEFAAFMIFVDFIVADIDTVTVAALMVVIQVNSVSFMPAFGLASAGAILTGQAIGADQRDAVPGVLRRTMTATAVWQVSVGVIYVLAPATIMAAFAARDGEGASTSTPEIVEVGALLLALSAAWQLFDAVAMSFAETLRAAGDTAWPMWARLSIAWFVFLPVGYAGVVWLEGGGVAAVLSIVLYIALLALALGWRFRGGAWRSIEMTGDGPPVH